LLHVATLAHNKSGIAYQDIMLQLNAVVAHMVLLVLAHDAYACGRHQKHSMVAASR
jgi:hypothetical protein